MSNMPDVIIAAGKVAAHNLTLTAHTVTSITFTDNIGSVDVISDGAAPVYYSVDGSQPTVGGTNCYLIPAGGTVIDTRPTFNSAAPDSRDIVRLISSGTCVVSVQQA